MSLASASAAARRRSSSALSRLCATTSSASFVPMATSAKQAARRADKLGDWRIPSRRSTDLISRIAPLPSAASLTTSNDNVPIIWRNNVVTAGSSLATNAASACPRKAKGNPSVCNRLASAAMIFPRQGASRGASRSQRAAAINGR